MSLQNWTPWREQTEDDVRLHSTGWATRYRHGTRLIGERRMIYGYARVSTQDQDPSLQENALRAAGCTELVTEHASGAKRERPALEGLLARVVLDHPDPAHTFELTLAFDEAPGGTLLT